MTASLTLRPSLYEERVPGGGHTSFVLKRGQLLRITDLEGNANVSLLLELWHETKLTVFMVTHDLSEGFSLGTRLLVFDKVRVDPHAPNAFGARITYDIPLNSDRRATRAAVEALPAHVTGNPQPAL